EKRAGGECLDDGIYRSARLLEDVRLHAFGGGLIGSLAVFRRKSEILAPLRFEIRQLLVDERARLFDPGLNAVVLKRPKVLERLEGVAVAAVDTGADLFHERAQEILALKTLILCRKGVK